MLTSYANGGFWKWGSDAANQDERLSGFCGAVWEGDGGVKMRLRGQRSGKGLEEGQIGGGGGEKRGGGAIHLQCESRNPPESRKLSDPADA